jgi:hypothetical protein
MFLRRLLLTAPVLATLILCFGCAADPFAWDEQPRHSPLPAYFVEVADVERVCRSYPGFTTHGCAVRDYSRGVCFVYTGPNPQAWLRTHELAHCAGYDHPLPRG